MAETAEQRAARLAEEERQRQSAIEAEQARNNAAVEEAQQGGQLKVNQPVVEVSNADHSTKSQTTNSQQGVTTNTGTSSQMGTSASTHTGTVSSESQRELTPEAAAAGKQAHDEYMIKQGYVQDADGNWKLNQTLFDALNIPRKELAEERERQEKQNRMKQLAAGLYHSGALLSDMISAGTGGNVWKREKDDTAANAASENNKLRTLQLAEDVAFAEKQHKDLQAALDKAQQIGDQRARDLMRTVSKQESASQGTQMSNSTSLNKSVQTSQSVGTHTTVQGTTYANALKGGGASGYSGNGGGGAYIPIRMANGPHGENYLSFRVSEGEKDALAHAIARSIEEARSKGDPTAKKLWVLYFTPGNSGKGGKTPTQDKWNYDGLIQDGQLYNIPGVLNRYLDELTRMGMKHTVNGKEVPFTRDELYDMMTGDVEHAHIPSGVSGLRIPEKKEQPGNDRGTNPRAARK